VTAASQLGEVHLLVAGKGVGGVAERRPRSPACRRSMSPIGAHLEHQLAEDVAPIAAQLMASHDAFLAPATTTGKNVAPRVAALLDVMQSPTSLRSRAKTLHPPIYAGNAIATVKTKDRQEGHHRPRHRLRKGAASGGRARSKPSTPAALRASRASCRPSLSKSERPELPAPR
jgi:electron transfer flavoprotein alpha subunit